ncbi:Ras association domain-containing protein 9 PAM COOH-terminal interactor protein 1 [Triplophysa tibetana]|uniref:Ras association domain-containing protein 9 PAM COOH-terminal interactor protein 1 n=1 Tax=Triplophysa tibetana TaxID=1572043 RepID=A0A5A9P0D6_9TELE|nr:Ras association domain-containing protein 9 PAM COOH-terminal interactor protein 1 [Triplophysa tibetana]
MAPFGKNFLKARLKNRSKAAEETEGKEIQVRVFQEEKIVCGVTKHTTCADLVEALLEDHKTIPESKRLLHGEPKDFVSWNGGRDLRELCHLSLESSDCGTLGGAKRASRSRGARSRRLDKAPAQYAKTVTAEKQKRMVKKAFRKLEKIQKEDTSEGSEEISKMVRLIISQDQTMRQQIQQMRELDLEIEHLERQVKSSPTPPSSLTECEDGQALPLFSSELDNQMQEYFNTSDGIEQLDLHICRHQELIDRLSRDIDLELRSNPWTFDSEELKRGAAASPEPELGSDLTLSSSDLLELESLRSELQSSMRAGLSLHSQAQDIEKELQQNNTALQSRNQEYQHLVAQFGTLELGTCPDQPVSLKSQNRAAVSQQTSGKIRQTCVPTDATDTDSDTGISSTHSQDSLSPCVDRSPPLDTDV